MSATAAAVAALHGYSAVLGHLHSRLTGARLKEARVFAEGVLQGMSAEDLADRIGIIARGRLAAIGTLAEIKERCAIQGQLEDVFLKLTREA